MKMVSTMKTVSELKQELESLRAQATEYDRQLRSTRAAIGETVQQIVDLTAPVELRKGNRLKRRDGTEFEITRVRAEYDDPSYLAIDGRKVLKNGNLHKTETRMWPHAFDYDYGWRRKS